MRSACFVLLIAAFAFAAQAASVPPKLSDTEEFQNIVDYLNENASGSEIVDIIECFSDVLDDMSPQERSVSSVVEELFHEIPWAKVNKYLQAKLAGHPKFAKLYSMLNDSKFQALLDKAVTSQALRDYTKTVETSGFTWSSFVSFAFKAICDTAIVSHHDVYSEGVCKALKDL